ncbi:MAG: tRNA preQ1(34) S-adenosylmethionine ribosyltransferase-isomerase QueA [Chitinispirillia bacterium]|jgi:S-adenosylmethionine:tRNA ribosyltransferase-isomerase
MKTSDFYYDLPEHLIAQEPLERRDSSRLLHLSRTTGNISHCYFNSLPALIRPGDRIVVNNTKVVPARLFCFKETGARIEFLFTGRINENQWYAMVKPSKRLKTGHIVYLVNNREIRFRVDKIMNDGMRVISLHSSEKHSIDNILNEYGEIPLPPYIHRRANRKDQISYQTVYAKKSGAVAAPTAGLHFTSELIEELKNKNISFSAVTLHVGIGTFRPIKNDNPEKHDMHEEEFELSHDTAEEITQTKKNGGRIIAVGTTVVRVLEHCAASQNILKRGYGKTKLFILPGYTFKIVDGLITNFHLPCSTLLMLVSAFAEKDKIFTAYHSAIQKNYRFYSYGDAMFIL